MRIAVSIVEAFAQGGRAAVTSRIYPDTAPLHSTTHGSAHLQDATVAIEPWVAQLFAESTQACQLFSDGAGLSAVAEAFELGSCWVDL